MVSRGDVVVSFQMLQSHFLRHFIVNVLWNKTDTSKLRLWNYIPQPLILFAHTCVLAYGNVSTICGVQVFSLKTIKAKVVEESFV